MNLLRITLKDTYGSTLHILKNKFLKIKNLKLDIHNKSIAVTSFRKNLYFFRTTIFDLLEFFKNKNLTYFNVLAIYSNSTIIDYCTFLKYKKTKLLNSFYFFKQIYIKNYNNLIAHDKVVFFILNTLLINYYILFDVYYILNYNFFFKNNLF